MTTKLKFDDQPIWKFLYMYFKPNLRLFLSPTFTHWFCVCVYTCICRQFPACEESEPDYISSLIMKGEINGHFFLFLSGYSPDIIPIFKKKFVLLLQIHLILVWRRTVFVNKFFVSHNNGHKTLLPWQPADFCILTTIDTILEMLKRSLKNPQTYFSWWSVK